LSGRGAAIPLALAALAGLIPSAAAARSLAREGTVAILPSARFGSTPAGFDGGAVAPALGLSFGFKPEAALEVAIDVGLSRAILEGAGARWEVLSVPLAVRLGWTPTPALDVRPVLHLGVGKALVAVDGPAYREHTPWVLQATAGVQADLSDAVGLWIDGGYLHARTEDPALGDVDAGGVLARAGLYFRFEPLPARPF